MVIRDGDTSYIQFSEYFAFPGVLNQCFSLILLIPNSIRDFVEMANKAVNWLVFHISVI